MRTEENTAQNAGSFLNVLTYYSHPQTGTEEKQTDCIEMCAFVRVLTQLRVNKRVLIYGCACWNNRDRCYLTKTHLIGVNGGRGFYWEMERQLNL